MAVCHGRNHTRQRSVKVLSRLDNGRATIRRRVVTRPARSERGRSRDRCLEISSPPSRGRFHTLTSIETAHELASLVECRVQASPSGWRVRVSANLHCQPTFTGPIRSVHLTAGTLHDSDNILPQRAPRSAIFEGQCFQFGLLVKSSEGRIELPVVQPIPNQIAIIRHATVQLTGPGGKVLFQPDPSPTAPVCAFLVAEPAGNTNSPDPCTKDPEYYEVDIFRLRWLKSLGECSARTSFHGDENDPAG
jgi:hypothetical protein